MISHPLVLIGKCDIPYSWRCNDSNEKDTTPAERVRGLEDEDVLQEECVQLSQLEQCRKIDRHIQENVL